jgi:hypothetical protein
MKEESNVIQLVRQSPDDRSIACVRIDGQEFFPRKAEPVGAETLEIYEVCPVYRKSEHHAKLQDEFLSLTFKGPVATRFNPGMKILVTIKGKP